MNREEVLNSILLKKRFCKDCNLPITVFDNPYFLERVEALDILHNSNEKFELFCKELERFPNEQSYFEYYNMLKDTIMEDIKSTEEFKEFNSRETGRMSPKYPKKELYTEENKEKYFVSLDMQKANFTALHHYSPAIFRNCDTWEEYISQFTELKHIINSKYIRQVVMGNCNPKRQVNYEYYLMEKLLDELLNKLPELQVYSLTTDEIIISVSDYKTFPFGKLCDFLNNNIAGIGSRIKMEVFYLSKIIGTQGWIKFLLSFAGGNEKNELNKTNKVKFKCLDAEIYHQIVKYFYNKELTINDLVFYHNGRLGRFLEPIENPWEYEQNTAGKSVFDF